MIFLHFGGPCDSIVTLGAHFATLGDSFLHVFRTWWDLGSPFVSLVGWLVVGVYVCLCVFKHFAAHFHVLFALWEAFF